MQLLVSAVATENKLNSYSKTVANSIHASASNESNLLQVPCSKFFAKCFGCPSSSTHQHHSGATRWHWRFKNLFSTQCGRWQKSRLRSSRVRDPSADFDQISGVLQLAEKFWTCLSNFSCWSMHNSIRREYCIKHRWEVIEAIEHYNASMTVQQVHDWLILTLLGRRWESRACDVNVCVWTVRKCNKYLKRNNFDVIISF